MITHWLDPAVNNECSQIVLWSWNLSNQVKTESSFPLRFLGAKAQSESRIAFNPEAYYVAYSMDLLL